MAEHAFHSPFRQGHGSVLDIEIYAFVERGNTVYYKTSKVSKSRCISLIIKPTKVTKYSRLRLETKDTMWRAERRELRLRARHEQLDTTSDSDTIPMQTKQGLRMQFMYPYLTSAKDMVRSSIY